MILALALLAFAAGGDPTDAQTASLPQAAIDALNGKAIATKVRACTCLNPFYQRGDFDGDGKADVAVLVKSIATNKVGVLIAHSKDGSAHLVGAGTPLGNGGDDFAWMDAWHVDAAEGAQRERLVLEKTESASGVVRWDGRKYLWEQAGD